MSDSDNVVQGLDEDEGAEAPVMASRSAGVSALIAATFAAAAKFVVPKLLLCGEEAAEFVGVSRSEFYRLDSMGVTPSPVQLGKVKRWSRQSLEQWVAEGCPPRHRSQERRK